MAWANESRIFRAFITDNLTVPSAFDLDAASNAKVALFNNSVTPAPDAANSAIAYNTGTWVVANEVSQSGQWAAGGIVLGSPTVTNPASGVTMFDGADTASGSAATLANVFGALVYSDATTSPVADEGICYNYFGGGQSVTNGTFTIVWAANGIFRITT